MLERQTVAAVVQLTSTPQRATNVETALALTRRAAAAGAKLVVLPENTSWLGPEHERAAAAEPLDGTTCSRFASLAAELSVCVLLGSFVEQLEPERKASEAESSPAEAHLKTANTSVLFGRDGRRVAVYRKLHLFDVQTPEGHVLRESDGVRAGDAVVTAELGPWRLGLSICYDLRFPELYRSLVDGGAHLLCVPAAFTAETGRDHWTLLLRARAVENLCYVAAPNQFGLHYGNRRCYGRSAVVDPWGTVLASCPDRPGFALAELDLDALEATRRRFPCLEHRRRDVL